MALRLRTQIHPFSEKYEDSIIEQDSIQNIFNSLHTNTNIKNAIIFVEDERITKDFDQVPKENSRVYIRIVPEGEGADNKQVGEGMKWGGGILMALGIAAYFIPAVGGFIGSALIMSGAGVLAGGVVLYNSQVNVPTVKDRVSPEQDPSIKGARNQERQYGSLPVVFGRHLINADVASKTYTFVDNRDGSQWIHQLFCLGYNNSEIELDSIKLGDTKLADFSSTKDINKILEKKDALVDMQIIRDGSSPAYFSKCVKEDMVNAVLKHTNDSGSSGAIIRTTADNCTAINVDIFWLSGLFQYNDEGNVDYLDCRVKAWYKKEDEDDSKYKLIEDWNFSKKNTKTIRVSHYSGKLEPGKYTVKVERVTEDRFSSKQVDTVYLGSIRSYTDERPINAERQKDLLIAVIAIKASDMAQGIIDNFNCIVQSKIPDYTGNGSGAQAWVEKLTQNPASEALYAMRGKINSSPISDEDIDWASFEKWHTFCEEHKYYFNAVLTDSMTISELFSSIASVGRASIVKIDGKFSVVIDEKKSSPVQLFTPRNSIDFSESIVMADIPDQLDYNFIDENSGFTQNTRSVFNTTDGLIDSKNLPKTRQETSVWGITNAEQVFKFARYQNAVSNLRRSIYIIKTDIECLMCQKGDLIEYSGDAALTGKSYGRIKSLILNEEGKIKGITTDTKFLLSYGTDNSYGYGLRVRKQDGSLSTYFLSQPRLLENSCYFSTPLDANELAEGDLFVFGTRNSLTLPLIIVEITPSDDFTAELKCVDYAPEIFNVDNSSYIVPNFDNKLTVGGVVDSGYENIREWQTFRTYNDSKERPAIPTGDGTENGWHLIHTAESRWESHKTAKDIFSGNWSAPLGTVENVEEKIEALPKADTVPPTVPVVKSATSTERGNAVIVFSGSTDSESGVDYYSIYRRKSDINKWQIVGQVKNEADVGEFSYTDEIVEKQISYKYSVSATDKSGNTSNRSASMDFKSVVSLNPIAPTSFTAQAQRDCINLAWQPFETFDAALKADFFVIQISKDSGENWTELTKSYGNSFVYNFDRNSDGFPEKSDLEKYQFRIKAVSAYKLESAWLETTEVGTGNYKTWKLGEFSAKAVASENLIIFEWSVDGVFYGTKSFDLYLGTKKVATKIFADGYFYRFSECLEKSDIENLDFKVVVSTEADSKENERIEIDVSSYKTYKITKPSVTAYADKQGIHISWSDNTSDYYLKPAYKLTIDGKEVLSAADTLDYNWLFAENTYPTKAEVLAHTIILSVSTAADSVEISDIAIDISVFKGWIPDVPDIKLSVSGRTVPVSWNIQSDNVYDFLGCELQVAKGYKVIAGKYSVITDESELEWFAPALGLNPYDSLENYKKGDKDGYLSVKGSSVAFSVPLFGQDNDGAMNTMYVYRARAFTKGGKSEWSDAYFVEVKPVSAYDVVKAWDINDSGEKVKIDGALGANQIFVNELSAVCANLGYITDGALQGDQYNYWAVNDTVLKDGSTLHKGAFRVGGVNKYIKVIPKVENGAVIDYDVELHVGDFSMSATGTLIEGGYFTVKDSKSNVLFQLTPEKAMIQVNEGTYNSNELIDIYASNATTSPTELRTAENYHWFDSKLYFAEVTENSSSSYTISVYEVSGKTTALKRTLNAVTKDYWFQDGYIYYNSTTTILFKKKNCIKKTKISNGSNTNYTDLGNKPDFTEIAYFGDYIMYLDDSDSDNKLLYLYNLTTNTKSESFNASNKTISIAAATDDSNYIYVMLTASFVTIFLRFSKSNMTWEVTGSTFIPRGDVSEFSKNLQIKDGGITVFCRFGFFPTNTSTANQEGIVMLENPMFEFANNLDNLSAISNITIYGNDVSSSEADKSVYIPIYSNDNKIYVQNLEDYCIYSVDKFLSESEVECYGAVWKGSVSYKKVQSLSEKNGEIGNTITACCCFSFKDEQEDNNSFLFCGLKVFQNTETSGYNEVCVVGSYESEQYNKKTKAVYETGIGFTGIYFNSLNNTYRYVTDTGAYLEFDENGKLITAKGETGATGPQGKQGQSAGFGDITASVDDNTGIPEVTVTTKGFDSKKYIDFAFKNLKGKQGEPGVSVVKVEQIETSTEDGGTNKIRITLSNGSASDFVIKNGNSSTIDTNSAYTWKKRQTFSGGLTIPTSAPANPQNGDIWIS